MSAVSVFDESQNTLGEGLLVDDSGNRLFWVDIVESKILAKSLSGTAGMTFSVDSNPSALLSMRDSSLVFCDRRGLASLDVSTGDISSIDLTPDIGENSDFRANDGTGLRNGNLIYGTMEDSPTGMTGGVYGYNGACTLNLDVKIGIPNGFVCLGDSRLLIADSLKQRIDLYELDADQLRIRYLECWRDFSDFGHTPDGGCLADDGYVYFALWDGFGIAVLDRSGKMVGTIELPVPRPTNCKVSSSGRLYVTSAREGLSDQMLRDYPLSGSVFEVDL